VPVLRDDALDRPDVAPPAEVEHEVVPRPEAQQPNGHVAAEVEDDTLSRVDAAVAEPAAAPPIEPVVPEPAARPSGIWSAFERQPAWARISVFAGVLLLLVVAGIAIGRVARDDGTTAAKPAARPKPAPAKRAPAKKAPAVVHWGPLRATPVGRLAVSTLRPGAAAAGGKLAVVGGTAASVQIGTPRKGFSVGKLPTPLAAPVVLTAGGTVYAVGGQHGTGTPSDGILRIDLATGHATPAGTFVEPLTGAGYAQSGSGVLIAGGWTGTQYASAILRFTLPGTAALVTRLPEGVRDPAVALHGGKLYVAGGRTASGPSAQVYVVDLATGGVSVVGRLPQPVWAASLVVAGGQLYLLGGRTASGPVASVVRIDPASRRIESAGRMPRPLADAGSVRLGAATLVVGGTQGRAVTAVAAG